MQPPQYRCTQLEYRFAVISEAPSIEFACHPKLPGIPPELHIDQNICILMHALLSAVWQYPRFRYRCNILSVPKFTANLYCICLSIDLQYTHEDAVQIYGKFWDTQ